MARVLTFVALPLFALASQHAGGDSLSLIQLKARAHEADPPVQTGATPVFLNGDGAEVFIETGPFANSWVPCTILRSTLAGWYDVRVMVGAKKGRNHTDVHGIKPGYLRQILPEDYDEHLAAFLASNESSALASMVEREANRRKRAAAALKKARDYAREIVNKGCPGEYIVMEGNIPGNDHFGRGAHNQLASVELCAEDCDRHPGCKAFEFDPLTTVCNLKKNAEPQKNYVDSRYMLCQHFEYSNSAAAAAVPSGPSGPASNASSQAANTSADAAPADLEQ
mmetsp:Transcript_89038/g.207215  ORF Transcript_89038/g.207215 Transcript_89038/m.207215 type:complete len:281 (-) Transcript_89038:60-902(-)